MSEITMLGGEGDWTVWIHLEEGNPTRQGESFVISSGETQHAAIESALKDLEETAVRVRRLHEARR